MIHNIIKGQPNQGPELAWKQNIRKYFDLYASFGCSFNIYTKEVLFGSNLSWLGCSHFGSLFTGEEQKKDDLWHSWYFCHTFQSSSWCHRLCQNGSAHGRVPPHRLSNVHFLKQSRPHVSCSECILHSVPVDRARDASLPGVPFKSRFSIVQSHILLLQLLMAKAVVAHLTLATSASF